MSDRPVFFYDYSSVYAYLASTRLEAVLGVEPEWHPVWMPAVLAAAGRESWVFTDRREEGLREVAERAERYGVPFRRSDELIDRLWGRGSLVAQRAGVVAMEADALVPYSKEVFRRFFAEGEDLTDPATVARAAEAVGLDGEETLRRSEEQPVKDRVRELTDEGIARGVFGVPTLAVGDELFWGDDRLEDAARALA